MTRPPLSDPAMLVATVGGVGLIPWAPGTWGSLVGVGLAGLVAWSGLGALLLLPLCLALFLVGWWAAGRAARLSGTTDPGFAVIDEVVGQSLVLAAVPPSITAYAGGFILFRLFDIAKPWPIKAIETHFRSGFGIMADDVMAAVYAGVMLYLGLRIIR